MRVAIPMPRRWGRWNIKVSRCSTVLQILERQLEPVCAFWCNRIGGGDWSGCIYRGNTRMQHIINTTIIIIYQKPNFPRHMDWKKVHA